MLRSFKDEASEAVFDGRRTKGARKRLPESLWRAARRRLEHLDSAEQLNDLRVPPGNQLEALKGERYGQYSIRINEQYRICFRWSEGGAEEVEIVNYH